MNEIDIDIGVIVSSSRVKVKENIEDVAFVFKKQIYCSREKMFLKE